VQTGYRHLWESAGYDSNMGSCLVVPPPPPEFIRVYYLTSAEFAISNIALGRVKVSRFSDLNDPFELLSPNFKERHVRRVIRAFKQRTDGQTGLLCFSSNWTNPVLWSHYGARHSGICLGFNLQRSLAQEIDYRAERLVEQLDESADPDRLDERLTQLLLRTKFSHWAYEGERRMVVSLSHATQEGNLHFLPFQQSLALAEVILGAHCRLPVEAVRLLTKRCWPDAVTYGARLAFKKFEVVPQEQSWAPYRGPR
jgi:hypothetical protein